jgi:hypothetical protein
MFRGRVFLALLLALALESVYAAPSTAGPSLAGILTTLQTWLEGVQKIGFVLGMLVAALGFITKGLIRSVPSEYAARLDLLATGAIFAGFLTSIGVLAGPYLISLVAEKFFSYSMP